jgi:hypothetical protein
MLPAGSISNINEQKPLLEGYNPIILRYYSNGISYDTMFQTNIPYDVLSKHFDDYFKPSFDDYFKPSVEIYFKFNIPELTQDTEVIRKMVANAYEANALITSLSTRQEEVAKYNVDLLNEFIQFYNSNSELIKYVEEYQDSNEEQEEPTDKQMNAYNKYQNYINLGNPIITLFDRGLIGTDSDFTSLETIVAAAKAQATAEQARTAQASAGLHCSTIFTELGDINTFGNTFGNLYISNIEGLIGKPEYLVNCVSNFDKITNYHLAYIQALEATRIITESRAAAVEASNYGAQAQAYLEQHGDDSAAQSAIVEARSAIVQAQAAIEIATRNGTEAETFLTTTKREVAAASADADDFLLFIINNYPLISAYKNYSDAKAQTVELTPNNIEDFYIKLELIAEMFAYEKNSFLSRFNNPGNEQQAQQAHKSMNIIDVNLANIVEIIKFILSVNSNNQNFPESNDFLISNLPYDVSEIIPSNLVATFSNVGAFDDAQLNIVKEALLYNQKYIPLIEDDMSYTVLEIQQERLFIVNPNVAGPSGKGITETMGSPTSITQWKGGLKKTQIRRKLRRSCRITKKRKCIVKRKIIRNKIMKTKRRVMKSTFKKSRAKM